MEVTDMASPALRQISSTLSPKQCVHHAHVVIVMQDFSQDYHESPENWFLRVDQACQVYADAIRMTAATHCKVLIGGNGPICRMAEVKIPSKTHQHQH